MKILHVCLSLPDVWGGPPRALANMARAQAARGDDVLVLPSMLTSGPQTLDPGDYGKLRVMAPPSRGPLLWYDAKLKRELRRLAQDRDIVHIHGTWRYHMLGAAAVAKELGIPYIIRPAGNLGEVCRRHKSYLKIPYFEFFERGVINRGAALHCTSAKERTELIEIGIKSRAFVIPQPIVNESAGVPADADGLRQQCGAVLDGAAGIIAYLGRVSRIKSIETLLEAFIRLADDFPGWRLIIAGPHEDASITRALAQRIQQCGLAERVALPGMIRGAAKSALLSTIDIFAQPSSHENFGISVAEALLFGRPCVVSTGVALASDIVAAGAGLSCSGVAGFEAALRSLIENDALRRQQGAAAALLASQFTSSSVAEQLNREYIRCLSGEPVA